MVVAHSYPAYSGQALYVDGNNSDATDAPGYGATRDRPFKSVPYAKNAAVDGDWDIIVVMAGHTEVLNETDNVLTVDKKGLYIYGEGGNQSRGWPTFYFDTPGTTVEVAAEDVTFSNLVLHAEEYCSVDNVLTLSSSGFRMNGGGLYLSNLSNQAETAVRIKNAANACFLTDVFIGSPYPGSAQALLFEGGPQLVVFRSGRIIGNFSAGAIVAPYGVSPQFLEITDSYLVNMASSVPVISFSAGVTGHVARNIISGQDPTVAIEPGLCLVTQNDIADGAPFSVASEAVLDPAQGASYWTQPQDVAVVTARADMENLTLFLDLDKSTTGLATVLAGQTIEFTLQRSPDGTAFRRVWSSGTIAASASGGEALAVQIGPLGRGETAKLRAVCSVNPPSLAEVPIRIVVQTQVYPTLVLAAAV